MPNPSFPLDSTLPIELDDTDLAILRALMENGRQSFREIGRSVGVSSPTVESHVRRLFQIGVIRRITAILDIDKMKSEVSALILLKVNLPELERVLKNLSVTEQIRNIFVTTGEANLVIRVVSSSNEEIQNFLVSRISILKGVSVVSSQIITKTFKDEQGAPLISRPTVGIECDYCKGEIKGSPFVMNVGEGKRFFCCKVCRDSYKEKYGHKVHKLTGQHGSEHGSTPAKPYS